MAAIIRIGDTLTTGHLCTGVTTLASSNQKPSVYSNGIPVCVVGAPTVVHTIKIGNSCTPHTAFLNTGSPNVYTEGISQGRVGDSADAGIMISGSPNVFVNGGTGGNYDTTPTYDDPKDPIIDDPVEPIDDGDQWDDPDNDGPPTFTGGGGNINIEIFTVEEITWQSNI